MPDDKRGWISKALFSASTAAGTVILSAGAPMEVAAVAAAGGALANLVYDLASTRSQRRGQAFVTELGGGDGARALAALAARKDEPVVQDTILEMARALAESLSDCVVPALANLTNEYLSANRPADAFFRGMRRLLSDLSEDEYLALRDFVSRVASVDQPNNQQRWVGLERHLETMSMKRLTMGRPVGSLSSNEWSPPKGTQMNQQGGELQWSPTLVRLFHLLNANGFGVDVPSVFGVSSARYTLVLEIDLARRLSALIS